LRRKRSSSQPATRTLPRLPKQTIEADLQFIPGEASFRSLRRKDLLRDRFY
jgi:hypothetical protein